jgi:hypothetical protein
MDKREDNKYQIQITGPMQGQVTGDHNEIHMHLDSQLAAKPNPSPLSWEKVVTATVATMVATTVSAITATMITAL